MRSLLLIIASLFVMSAGAQFKASTHQVAAPVRHEIPAPKLERMDMRAPGTPVVAKAPKKVEYHDAYYNRPAGMFPGSMFMEPDGSPSGIAFAPYYATKAYAPYTFKPIYDMEKEDTEYEWDFQYWDSQLGEDVWETLRCEDATYIWPLGVFEMPVLWVFDGPKMLDYQMSGSYQGSKYAAHVMAAPNAAVIFSDIDEGGAILVSSKSFCWGGFANNHDVPFSYYSGIDPYDTSAEDGSGFWFGKNGGTVTRDDGTKRPLRIDGIAQAFEKPSHPYLLKQVVLDATEIEVVEQVDMTCKIYKLDEIPAYMADDEVVLPDEPGEQIAYGRATLTPETDEYIIFTIYDEEDGLEVEYTPTIDEAILIVIDGYNDPEMDNLRNFSALISSDMDHDEGFGELAYLKYGVLDEDGNVDHYLWAGLNNFFTSGAMMTGFSIFLDIENPFLTFGYSLEDGEYTFPDEGGLMEKVLYDDGQQQLITRSIEFFSWVESVDEGWTLSCDGDDVPDWLSITLTDGEENGEFDYSVNAEVVAEPLPEGVEYREAIVRFEFPGAYLDYKFMQGVKPDPQPQDPFDVNGDGEVNIGDVNAAIDMILSGREAANGDVNGDGEVNIADVNALIDHILSM